MGVSVYERWVYAVLHRGCETASMRNVTVSIDEETHRLARIRAAELETSVSALVRDFLSGLVGGQDQGWTGAPRRETAQERRRRLLSEMFADFDARGIGLRMEENLPREALYDRAAARAEAESERNDA